MLPSSAIVKHVVLSWTVFYAAALLFGAPFFSDIVSTAVLATALTVVAVAPAVLIFETEESLLEAFFLAVSGEDNKTSKETVYLSSVTFSVLGAWAAAAVHPLDWDRWWQRYPLPSLAGCICGALLGTAVGSIRVLILKHSQNQSKRR